MYGGSNAVDDVEWVVFDMGARYFYGGNFLLPMTYNLCFFI